MPAHHTQMRSSIFYAIVVKALCPDNMEIFWNLHPNEMDPDVWQKLIPNSWPTKLDYTRLTCGLSYTGDKAVANQPSSRANAVSWRRKCQTNIPAFRDCNSVMSEFRNLNFSPESAHISVPDSIGDLALSIPTGSPIYNRSRRLIVQYVGSSPSTKIQSHLNCRESVLDPYHSLATKNLSLVILAPEHLVREWQDFANGFFRDKLIGVFKLQIPLTDILESELKCEANVHFALEPDVKAELRRLAIVTKGRRKLTLSLALTTAAGYMLGSLTAIAAVKLPRYYYERKALRRGRI